jgi:hypothetical protein
MIGPLLEKRYERVAIDAQSIKGMALGLNESRKPVRHL